MRQCAGVRAGFSGGSGGCPWFARRRREKWYHVTRISRERYQPRSTNLFSCDYECLRFSAAGKQIGRTPCHKKTLWWPGVQEISVFLLTLLIIDDPIYSFSMRTFSLQNFPPADKTPKDQRCNPKQNNFEYYLHLASFRKNGLFYCYFVCTRRPNRKGKNNHYPPSFIRQGLKLHNNSRSSHNNNKKTNDSDPIYLHRIIWIYYPPL